MQALPYDAVHGGGLAVADGPRTGYRRWGAQHQMQQRRARGMPLSSRGQHARLDPRGRRSGTVAYTSMLLLSSFFARYQWPLIVYMYIPIYLRAKATSATISNVVAAFRDYLLLLCDRAGLELTADALGFFT